MNVQAAAIALFNQEFKEFERVCLLWSSSQVCYVWRDSGNGKIHLAALFFHSDNVIVDLGNGTSWKKFLYADPVFPHDLINLLYHHFRDWFQHAILDDSIAVDLKQVQETIDLLIIENERFYVTDDNRSTSVVVV